MLIPVPPAAAPLSSLHSLSSQHFLLPARFLPPGGGGRPLRRGDLAIRMGGGPRTYPGGVSKWQWKRMQAKKARQLLKARLARERQLYEMRKRVELRDAVAHLERPWDPDPVAADAAPNLLSVAADDQLKALADRFHRPGGVDLWNERDGPKVFQSPATGAASARFFPKNAVHSVQPYALRDAAGEAGATVTRGGAAADVLLALGGRGVRENAYKEEAYGNGDGAPAVELMEKDGTWEPLHASEDGDDINAIEWSSDDDDAVTYESEGTGDVGSCRERHALVRRNGRNGMVRSKAANSAAVGRDDDEVWIDDAVVSDVERWQQRSRGARNRAGGRWNAVDTVAGSGTSERDDSAVAGWNSDSEIIRSGSQPKWRTRSKDGKGGAGRWSVPREDLIGTNSSYDSARVGKLETSWGTQRNKLNGRGSFRERFKPTFSGNTSDGEALERHMRPSNVQKQASSNNGDSTGGLEAPTWKPRRTSRARNKNGSREDRFGGTFRRGDNDASRRSQGNFRNTNEEGGRRMSRNGEQRSKVVDYSLRPTSELHIGWTERGSGGL